MKSSRTSSPISEDQHAHIRSISTYISYSTIIGSILTGILLAIHIFPILLDYLEPTSPSTYPNNTGAFTQNIVRPVRMNSANEPIQGIVLKIILLALFVLYILFSYFFIKWFFTRKENKRNLMIKKLLPISRGIILMIGVWLLLYMGQHYTGTCLGIGCDIW